ncbi:hypothetical protein [Nesterenkonia sp.]|uniref:hypothetical protein n=1 Tax=Nesterenkonia sp. TaxID=704201 RepID=UPI002602C3A7|nr:hypothetical protein [Nesterenkonia sp.]
MTQTSPSPAEQPPLLLHNGTIHSTAEPYAEAMLVRDGQVAWLGSEETADQLSLQEGTLRQDLDRALVTPAFVGMVGLDAQQAAAATVAEVLDVAAGRLGCGAVRLRITIGVEDLSGEGAQQVQSLLHPALRAAADHPVDVWPVIALRGVAADGGAPSISPVNTALDLLDGLDDLGRPVALCLTFSEVLANLLGARSWCAEAGRQLLIDCADQDPGAVVDAMATTQKHLRELKQTPSPATPTVLVGFDSAEQQHWEQLLSTGAHVLLTSPGHLAAALRVGVPTAAAPAEGENPWALVSAHVHHPEDPVSVRAGFNAQTRSAYRSLPGAAADAGQLNPGATATFALWEADQLAVQTPNSTVAAWSTDTRARTPLLPYLDGVTNPLLKSTVIAGERL